MSTSAETASHPKRRWRVPIVCIALVAICIAINWGMAAFDASPKTMMTVGMFTGLSMALAVLGLLVWFLFLGGFLLVTKSIIVGLIAFAIGAFFFTYQLEWSGMMTPIAVPRWRDDPAQVLKGHRAKQGRANAALNTGDWEARPDDFPRYRGPKADGVAPYVLVEPARLVQTPPKRVWAQPIGGGYSGFAVAGNVLVTLEQRGDDEAVVCYQRDSAKEAWNHSYPARFKQSGPMGGDGPRSTPTIHDGKVYALGAVGDLHCIDGESGSVLWKRNIVKDNGAVVPKWGITSSPLIVPAKQGEIVVVIAGIDPDKNQKKSIAAYDRLTGAPVWATGEHHAGYSSASLVEIGGAPQILTFDGGGLQGRDLDTGAELWRFDWVTYNEMNIAQPLVLPGNRVYISSFTEGSALLEIKQEAGKWNVKEVWRQALGGAHFSNPVHHNGYIYGLAPSGPRNFLICIDVADGKRLWRKEAEFGSAQLLLSGDTLLVQTERPCDIVFVKPSPKAYEELTRFHALEGDKTWNTPALAGGFLYLRNNLNMACFDVRPAMEK